MNIVPEKLRCLSLRTRVRWALFGFGAAAAIALAVGTLAIDETLEQVVMKSTLEAEAQQFTEQVRHSNLRRLNTAVLRGYFAPQSTPGDPVESDQDNEFRAPSNFDVDCIFNCTYPEPGSPTLFGTASTPNVTDSPSKQDIDASPLGSGPLRRQTRANALRPLPDGHAGGRLSRGLQRFFWRYASTAPAPPAAIRSLSPGFHEDIWLDGRAYYMLVEDLPGGRLYLSYDTTRLRQRLHWFAGLLLGSVLLILLAADRLGSAIANRLTQPLEALARRLKTMDPAQRGVRVAESQRDPELDQIAAAFNTYLKRMDDFVHREQAFTQTASHELRTPLTVISGAAELMHAQAANGVGHDERALRRIQRATRQMTETVEALLALARAVPSETDVICRIDHLLPDIVEAHAYLVEDAPVTIELGELETITVRAPPRLLDILIGNLLRNAVQNTREGRVRISLRDHRLEVTDTGTGFDPVEVPVLLRRGTRGAQALRQGHGLGLYIVSEICAHYGWTIALDTHRAGGAHVCVDFTPSSVEALQSTASKR